MKKNGISGTAPKRFKRTTDSKHDLAIADNVLNREFTVDAPDTIWATDVTYVPRPELLHHSDRGSQYASHDFRNALREHGIVCSMSRKGDCWDNAVVESFFATIKKELIHRRPWPKVREVRQAIVEYIEVFYNRSSDVCHERCLSHLYRCRALCHYSVR